jgi:hypothetical protein
VNIEDAEVEWREGVANPPQLVVYVDETPDYTDLTFEGSVEDGFWYGEDPETGYVEFFSWDGGQQDGFGGRHYEIELEDGGAQVLKGPWSSRAGVANEKGFGPCVKALYRAGSEQSGGRTGHLSLGRAQEVVDEYVEGSVELERVERFSDDETYFVPSR